MMQNQVSCSANIRQYRPTAITADEDSYFLLWRDRRKTTNLDRVGPMYQMPMLTAPLSIGQTICTQTNSYWGSYS